MKKLRRVIGSVTNLTSNRNDEQPATSAPKPGQLSSARRSVSGPLQETSPQRGSYYSYETQSLDSFNSGLTSATPRVDPYSKGDKHFTKLHKWAYLGDTNKLKKFIKKIPVDAQDGEGKTPLHYAAAQGHGDALLFLLGSKSNVELKDNAGMTALLRAVERSQQHIVQMFIQRRVEINVTDYQGNNSIHLAARTGATDLLLMLLECGIDSDSPNNLGRTPLHVACTENQEEAVEALLRHGASVNAADKEGVTPLMMAAKMGSVHLVEVLIDSGASTTPFDASKWTAADYARFTNHNQLYHRLKTLLEKEGGVSLIPQGLLSVSNEESEPTGGAPAALVKKTSDVEEEEQGKGNSWSDNSDIDSVKEKPKVKLTKFLPSSDESVENVPAATTDPPEGATGPPKPPRLYASTSSLTSDKLVAGAGGSREEQDKEDTVKDSDSWKSSSSEDEKPKVKSLGLFVGNNKSSVDNAGMKTRVGSEDLKLELGLRDMKYDLSDEDISFDEDKPDLPSEGTPSKAVVNLRNKVSPGKQLSSSVGSRQTSPSNQQQQPSLASRHKDNLRNNSVQSVSPSLSPARSDGSKKLRSLESPVKSLTKKSLKKKTKVHHRRSSALESDSDEGESNSFSLQKRKGSAPKKQDEAVFTKQYAINEDLWEIDVDCFTSRKSSPGEGIHENALDWKEDKIRLKSPKNTRDAVAHSTLLGPGGVGSRTHTLSTIVGTLGREGTMQEVEEMWEANASRKQRSSTSSSSPLNSKGSHKSDSSNSSGKLKKEAGESMKNTEELCTSAKSKENAAQTQVKHSGKGVSGKSMQTQTRHSGGGVDGEPGAGKGMEQDNEDTAQDVSDDDFGSSGVEDLLTLKVKDNATQQPHSKIKATTTPKREQKSHSNSHEASQHLTSLNRSHVTGKEKSLSVLSPKDVAKKSTLSLQPGGEKVSSPTSDIGKRYKKRKDATSPLSPSHRESSVIGVLNKGGLSGDVLSDDDLFSQDHVSSPYSLEEPDDRLSITSTETEESPHINAELKDSLLAPLSSLPDASNVDQLQDLVRELRLKLEKESGRKKDLEMRVLRLKQQEKKARNLCSQLEQDSHQKQQEISSLMARIKQLEYQGRSEQDSLVLRDHSLQDAQQRCCQLEEQCAALQVHAQQQEQLMGSLVTQLQTKERINLTLQDKLEELSSQTKYVSMKSCQTEDFLMFLAPRESAQAQTDGVCGGGGEDGLTLANSPESELCVKTGTPNSASGFHHEIISTDNIKNNTNFTQAKHSQKISTWDRGTQSDIITMTHAGCQNTPLRAFKTCQTHLSTKSSSSQTDSTVQDGVHVERNNNTDMTSSQPAVNMQNGRQTKDDVDTVTVSPKISQTDTLKEAVENILQDFSQDIKFVFQSSEACHSSVLNDINQSLCSQMAALSSSVSTALHQTESQSRDEAVMVQEGICQLEDTLQSQMDVLKQLSGGHSQAEMQNLLDTVQKLHLELKSNINALGGRIIEALQSQVPNQQEQNTLLASLMKQKEENNKILTNFSGQLDKRSDIEMERFNDLKRQIAIQLTEIKKVIELSSVSEDSGVPGNMTRGVVEKLDSIEKSLTSSDGRSCIPEELSGVQSRVQQLSDNLHRKVTALEELIRMLSSDSKQEQAALMEQTKAINDSNDHLTTLVKLRLSEANSDLSEAIEENFRIVQDKILHLQETILQRINEVSEHISIGEDKKGSNLARQMMEIASQLSSLHGGLAQVQNSVQQGHSTPTGAGAVDEALVSSLRLCQEQATETLKLQNDSIIRQLEALQKEVYVCLTKGQSVNERHEVQLLKESLKRKESEVAAIVTAKQQLQEDLTQQKIVVASLKSKEEEWRIKVNSLEDRIKDLGESLKEKENEVRREAAKCVAQGEDTIKLRQENFRLSSDHAKLSAVLQAEQHQRQWCEGELQGLKEAKDVTERRMQEIMSYVQHSSLQRTPPTGRDNSEDDTVAASKQEFKKLEEEKKKLEEQHTEQQNLACHLELRLKEAEAALNIEKSSKADLEKQLKKTKESVAKLHQELNDIRQQQEAMRDMETQQTELQMEMKAKESAMDTLRKKLEAINKEKLDLKNNIMQLNEEKLSFELIKQEKEFTEQMLKKTEEQLRDLQTRISRDYVSKASLHVLQKELESKYQLELSTKLAELNHIIQEQSKHQESLTKNKNSREQELKNELSRKSEEVIRLNAKLSVLDERGDTWRVRHDRLLALYQQQTDLNHSLAAAQKPQEEPLSVTLEEIDKHLKTPLATSSFLGQHTPPVSLQLPPPHSHIDSYHYTHAEALDRTLQAYLNSSAQNRYSAADDKPQAKISPLPSSPHESQHFTRAPVPDLNQSREEYVDLLKMKYGI